MRLILALVILLGLAADVALWRLNASVPAFNPHCNTTGYCRTH